MNHLTNIEELICNALKVITKTNLIDILFEKVSSVVDTHLILRDMQNLISFLKFSSSLPSIRRKLPMNLNLIQDFIDQAYAGFDKQIRKAKAKKVYQYIKNNISSGNNVDFKYLRFLTQTLEKDTQPDLDKLKERVLIAIIIKWLQGPLKNKLSKDLNVYIIFLAAIFGQYRTKKVLSVTWEKFKASEKDMAVIADSYASLEIAIMEAIETIRIAQKRITGQSTIHEQFHVIFRCLYNLFEMSKESQLDHISMFRNKIITSTTLIYLQDDIIEKDTELDNLIQLFVTLYYPFRDPHYTTESGIDVGPGGI